MIKCTECGYENMDGLDYCDGCGAKLTGAGQPPHDEVAQPVAKPVEETAGTGTPAPGVNPASPTPLNEPTTPSAMTAEKEEELAGDKVAAPAPEEAPAAPSEPAAPSPAPPPAAAEMTFKAKLKIVRGGRQGHEFPLEGGNNLVGRWDPETGAFPEVDMEADDPEAKISRKHALIRIENGKITVEDIGSLNGTYVNRQPRLQPGNPVEIKTGDEIIIGKTFLKLEVEPVS